MASKTSSEFTPTPKQAVFLFMAATVVAVVIFLCGLLVGRGVPLEGVLAGRGYFLSPGDNSLISGGRPTVASTPSLEPSAAALAEDDLTYRDRLDGKAGSDYLSTFDSDDRLVATGLGFDDFQKPVSSDTGEFQESISSTPPVPAPDRVFRSTDAAESVSRAVTWPIEREESYGFSVQVTALRERAAAEHVAARLAEKGYPAFVVDPLTETSIPVFRVRVGWYIDRSEAELVLHRLEQEEQFKPWIARY